MCLPISSLRYVLVSHPTGNRLLADRRIWLLRTTPNWTMERTSQRYIPYFGIMSIGEPERKLHPLWYSWACDGSYLQRSCRLWRSSSLLCHVLRLLSLLDRRPAYVCPDEDEGLVHLNSWLYRYAAEFLCEASLGVGEDGPTHQPIEQFAMIRAMPNIHLFRPADANEVVGAYHYYMKSELPVVLTLSRQNLPILQHSKEDKVFYGAYIIDDCEGKPDLVSSVLLVHFCRFLWLQARRSQLVLKPRSCCRTSRVSLFWQSFRSSSSCCVDALYHTLW